jgi:DNA polymerase-1
MNGLADYIKGVEAPEDELAKRIKRSSKTTKKKAVGKKVKVKVCKDCPNFAHNRNVDFEKYYINRAGDKTVAFILAPMDFENLTNPQLQWKFVMSMNDMLMNYNILFLPFPKCYESAWDDKIKVTAIKICREQWIVPKLQEYHVDLVVVFPNTKKILQVDKKDKYERSIRFEGNWSSFKGIKTYLAKSLFSMEKKGFDNDGYMHTVTRINRFFEGKLLWQRKKNFSPVSTIEQLEEVEREIEGVDILAPDVETSGLDVMVPDFRLKTIGLYWVDRAVSIGYEVEECVDVKYRERVKQFILKLLANPNVTKVFHNCKYEIKVFLRKFGMDVPIINYEDTQFLAYITDENRKSNSLKFLGGEFFDGYKDSPEDFEGANLEDLWYYNCVDAYYTLLLRLKKLDIRFQPTAVQEGLRNVYQLMLKQAWEVALLELGGVNVDFDYLKEFKIKLDTEVKEYEQKILTEFPATANRNLNATKQLADVLFSVLKYPIIKMTASANSKQPSTDKEVLVTLKEKHGCVLADYLLERKKRKKQLSDYVDAYLNKRDELHDDRLRSSYIQTKNWDAAEGEGKGTVTGRMSSAGPNLQNIARNKEVKRIFIPDAEKDHVILQADLSQAELRIGCSLAFEETMIEAYRNDEDIHAKTGLTCAVGKKLEAYKREQDEKKRAVFFKEIRQQGKPANFGLIYGGSHLVLMQIAKVQYGVELTEQEAMAMRRKYFEMYPAFLTWHESYHNFAVRHGYIVSPYGRVRHVPEVFTAEYGTREYGHIMNQVVNSPVQSACADFLADIWYDVAVKARKLKLDTRVVLTVHDSLVHSTHKNDVEELIYLYKDRTAKLTERYRQTWLQCPMKMDFEQGPTWGDLDELKLAA